MCEDYVQCLATEMTDTSIMQNSIEDVAMATSSMDASITSIAVEEKEHSLLLLPGIITLTMISIFLAITNILITLTVIVNKNLRTTSNFFYASLTTSAIFMSVITIPAITWSFSPYAVEGSNLRCLSIACLQTTGLISFVLNMLVSSFDMYYKLFYPFKYKKFMTIRKTVFLCALTWTVAVIFSWGPLFGWNNIAASPHASLCRMKNVAPVEYVYITIYIVLLPCTVTIVFLNARIVHMAKREARKIRTQKAAVNRTETADFRTGRKSTIALLIMLVVLLVGWLPFLTLLQIAAFCPQCIDDKLTISLSLLALASTATGPLIYGLRQDEYRETLKQLCMLKPLIGLCREPPTAIRNLPENV
ncbi:adenosine receptor A1-like [Glandiceps talaboti]